MKLLNQLRRLPENRMCGSCRHEDKLGFKNVCVKFQIFICDDCKSAHQAYSHRCKVRTAPPARVRLPPAVSRRGRRSSTRRAVRPAWLRRASP